jgi:dihydroorotate dehydrogenase
MYQTIRPLLFRLDAEQAHALTLRLLRWAGDFVLSRYVLRQLFGCDDARLAVELFGVHFANRVGLAAGYDKDGVAIRGLACLGFGHLEIGTVTRLPQLGNPQPRVFRIPETEALINRMGFPNAGADALQIARNGIRIGINIGKGKETPLDQAAEDYCALFAQLYRQADYIALNVSSPNTLNLRQLQRRVGMTALLAAVTKTRDALTPRVPLLVKVAPDLTDAEVDEVLMAIAETGADGVIATNTTIQRNGVPPQYHDLAGGLSGAPLCAQATAVVRRIARQTGGRLPIIGVGGIMTSADALARLDAGAHLVQLYTGLIYSGPGLVRAINRAMLDRFR